MKQIPLKKHLDDCSYHNENFAPKHYWNRRSTYYRKYELLKRDMYTTHFKFNIISKVLFERYMNNDEWFNT